MENTIGTGKAAKILGVTVKTLQRWEREKRFIPIARKNTNRRLYTVSQIRSFIGLQQAGGKEPSRQVAHCRVSSAAQKPDLQNQRRVLEEFIVAKGLAKWLMEVILGTEELKNVTSWLLLTNDAHFLYEKVGFISYPHPERVMIKKKVIKAK